eukprot:GFUD01010247.1.p1 GENE.GFUD01010247.1~~GFUD01010247.1.p1  ORF type:complete len:365 (+),score=103.37 GFUD01010247.1:83-1177(+)
MEESILILVLSLMSIREGFSLPVDIECTNQTICYGISMVFTDLSQGEDAILPGSGFDQQRDFIKNAVINLADENLDEKVDFQEFKDRSFEFAKTVFDLFDRNSDGALDDNEATIDKVSQKALKTGVNLIFDIFDQNQDQHISTEDIPNNEALDADNDGKVTLNELLSKLSGDQITNTIFLPKPIQTLYSILDSNKDERTSLKEVDNFINVVFKAFNVLDKDEDCFITMKEILQVMDDNEVRRDFQVAIDIVISPYIKLFNYLMRNFITKSDTNEDGKLDFEEVTNFSDMKLVENSLKTAVSLGNPNFSALYYIMGAPGGPDRFGRPNWEKNEDTNAAHESLAVWLSFADGLLRDKAFHRENSCQ